MADAHDRIVLTHDTKTFSHFAYARVNGGKHIAGVFVIPAEMSIGQAIEELLIACECSEMTEWKDVVLFFPL